ncbi:MAG: SDR family oxidoreductase [Chloroflexi bacterium]|nr:SDR family oxidoreductase [Chloroflexota bacterium]
MMDTLHGKTALITGASSGLGADFARQLAARGCQLVLVARRAERLRELQQEIATRHATAIDCITMDLVEADAPQRLYDQLDRLGHPIDVLVNNAGLGLYGEFTAAPWESLRQMLTLDIVALTQLTRLFAADMVKRRSGYLLLVASIGAFQPTPTYAVYSAAKSYVLSLGEALHYELRQTGVQCTVLCPGPTRTEFFDVAGQRMTAYQRLTMMDSSTVARIGLEAMLRGRSSVVAGRLNALLAWGTRLAPRQLLARLASQAMREPPR